MSEMLVSGIVHPLPSKIADLLSLSLLGSGSEMNLFRMAFLCAILRKMFAYFNFKQVFVRSKGLKACGSGFWIIWGDLGVEELFVQIERGKFNIFSGYLVVFLGAMYILLLNKYIYRNVR